MENDDGAGGQGGAAAALKPAEGPLASDLFADIVSSIRKHSKKSGAHAAKTGKHEEKSVKAEEEAGEEEEAEEEEEEEEVAGKHDKVAKAGAKEEEAEVEEKAGGKHNSAAKTDDEEEEEGEEGEEEEKGSPSRHGGKKNEHAVHDLMELAILGEQRRQTSHGRQGLTLVHFSAPCKRLRWERG